jgi:hypothetical protein
MDEAPATPKPRRRWKRWAIIFGVLTAIITGIWATLLDDEILTLARNVKLGQTRTEVCLIMRIPDPDRANEDRVSAFIWDSPIEERLRPVRNWLFLRGWWTFPRPYVHIHFDDDGRVDWIKRGDEVLGQLSQAKRRQNHAVSRTSPD